MRISIVGGGLAGTLLAWRLATRSGARIRLLIGIPGAGDATAASGGLVRGFEPDAWNAAAAKQSLAELYSDHRLREMAGYRETGSVYLPDTPCVVDGSVLDTAEVAKRFGITAPPGIAIVERRAGFIRPGRLRHRILALLPDLGVEVVPGMLDRLPAADVVVLATGPWTGRVLTTAGLPATGLHTKAIQYTVYTADGQIPPSFVDEHSGLYGRPAGPGQVLLGLPTQRWDVDPGGDVQEAEAREVAAVADRILPWLRLLTPVRTVAAVDAYAPDGRLRLRAVQPGPEGLFTFTGGSGGAAKTALAATASAATQLLGAAVPVSSGHRS